MSDTFLLAGKEFQSRLIIGTGKYRSFAEMQAAHSASGAEMVTVAVNRVPLDRSTESFLDYLSPSMQILPNTAGCYDAEHAIRTARLAREALETDWIKLEVIGDPVTLLPDNEQTLEAARILVKEGFIVLPYFSDDLIMAKKLLDAGCPAIMPLAAPIGSGLGVQNPANLKIMREQLPNATIIVDAGVGVPSDAAIAMELGADAILMNTAIAEAGDAAAMATAMNFAVRAGRLAYLSGRMPKRLYASASSPIHGAIKQWKHDRYGMNDPMTIEILFFGATADAAATRHTEVELVNSSTAGGLIERLIQKYPKLSDHRLLFAVNEEYAGPDTIVSHGDQFALFTPVSGG